MREVCQRQGLHGGTVREITNAASLKMGHKLTSTEAFIGSACQWLAKRTVLAIELNPLDQRYKVTHGGRFNTGNTLAIALANAVIDQA